MSVFLLNKISKLEAKPQNRVESAYPSPQHTLASDNPVDRVLAYGHVAVIVLLHTQCHFCCQGLIVQAPGFGKRVVAQLRGCFFE